MCLSSVLFVSKLTPGFSILKKHQCLTNSFERVLIRMMCYWICGHWKPFEITVYVVQDARIFRGKK